MVENTNAGCDVGRWHFDARKAADKTSPALKVW